MPPWLLCVLAAEGAAAASVAVFASSFNLSAGVSVAVGSVTKAAQNPLFVQDQPWETRIDNGYPNLAHDPDDPLGAFRLWYGVCAGNVGNCTAAAGCACAGPVLAYATSADGLAWAKPDLGLYNLSAAVLFF